MNVIIIYKCYEIGMDVYKVVQDTAENRSNVSKLIEDEIYKAEIWQVDDR